MAHDDRKDGTCHAGEEDGGRFEELNRSKARFELLGAVSHEVGPVLRTRNEAAQTAHHLAAVADAEAEGVGTGEEGRELFNELVVVEDSLRPAAAGAEHVAVGKAAAGGKSLEVGKIESAREKVRHMDVPGFKARTCKGGGHFSLGVDAFLAQDRDLRANARVDHRERNVFVDVERGLCKKTLVRRVGDGGEFLIRAFGVVAAAGNFMRDLGPGALEFSTREAREDFTLEDDFKLVFLKELAHEVAAVREAEGAHLRDHFFRTVRRDLHEGAEFLIEEGIQHRGSLFLEERREIKANADAGGEIHFRRGGKEAAVRAVVIGENASGEL